MSTAGWGLIAALSGLLYMATGVAVGYSGFEQPGGLVIQLLFVIFFLGVLVAGVRKREPTRNGRRLIGRRRT